MGQENTDALHIKEILILIESVPSPPVGFDENRNIAKASGKIAKMTRDNLESALGKVL